MKASQLDSVTLFAIVAISVISTAIGLRNLAWYCEFATQTMQQVYLEMSDR